jgi:hypothetical protein
MSLQNPQTELFSEPGAASRRADPDTAKEAAKRVPTARLESLVLRCLHGTLRGLTSHEISIALDLSLVTVSPRMRPLARKGLVVDSGERRETASGSRAIVWKIKL